MADFLWQVNCASCCDILLAHCPTSLNGAAWDSSGNIKTSIYFAEPIMYNSVRVLGRARGSVAVRRVLPNAVAATAR